MYFEMKNILKSNRNYIPKHALKVTINIRMMRYFSI